MEIISLLQYIHPQHYIFAIRRRIKRQNANFTVIVTEYRYACNGMEHTMALSREASEAIHFQRSIYNPLPDWKQFDFPAMRKAYTEAMTAIPAAEGTMIQTARLNNIPVERILVKGASKHILYIHGGGMTMGSPSAGRFMTSHVAVLSERNVTGVDYRLCPEYAFPAALEDCEAVYRALLAEGISPKDIAFLGESAGACLELSLLVRLQQHGLPLPSCVCAISPSVDAQYQSQSMTRNAGTEIIVNQNLPEMMRELYYKDTDPKDPAASPIYADLTSWSPVYFMVCREEILMDESIRMYCKLQEAGVETDLSIVEGLFHTYMLGDLPESHDAFANIAAFFDKY